MAAACSAPGPRVTSVIDLIIGLPIQIVDIGLGADRLSAEFSISAARQINEAISARRGDRRTGEVIGDRYHARPLTSPRAVRNTLAYVLNNYRHHGEDQVGVARTWKADPFSSGPLFLGWKELVLRPSLSMTRL